MQGFVPLQGPQGAQGIPGKNGSSGPKGQPGPPGGTFAQCRHLPRKNNKDADEVFVQTSNTLEDVSTLRDYFFSNLIKSILF